jgi:hypothetical protein
MKKGHFILLFTPQSGSEKDKGAKHCNIFIFKNLKQLQKQQHQQRQRQQPIP